MKKSEIEAAAKALVKAEVIHGNEPERFESHLEYHKTAGARDVCKTCDGCFQDSMAVYFAFQKGARWALKQVDEWADKEYDRRGDRPESESNDAERYTLAGCCRFCQIKEDE